MSSKIFIPSINPFIWLYLLLTGKLLSGVVCFRHKFVPTWRVERIRTSNLDSKIFSELHVKAIDFSKQKISQDKAARISIEGTTIDLSVFQYRKLISYVSDIMVSAFVLKTSGIKGVAYIETSLLFGANLENLEEWLASNSSLEPRRSIFIGIIYPVLNRSLLILFSVIIYMKDGLRWKYKSTQVYDYIFNQVTPTDNLTDYKKNLSCSILSAITDKAHLNINYIIKCGSTRKKWKNNGFNTIRSLTDLPVRPNFMSIVNSASSIMARHVSLNEPSSLLSVINLAYMNSAIKKSIVNGYISTVSCIESIPIEALAFRAHNKPTSILFYSSTMFHHVNMSYISFDHAFVWNELQKDFVLSFPQENNLRFHVMGPVMFSDDGYPDKKTRKSCNDEIIIGIYDVTPKPDQLIDNVRITTNYTIDYYKKFFEDILKLKNLDARIRLKNKQKRNEFQASNIDFSDVFMEPSNMNPYQSIDGCDIVICMPYTSIYFAAEHRSVPAIFYSSFDNYFYNGLKELDDKLIIGEDDLFKEVSKIIKQLDQDFDDKALLRKIEKRKSQPTPMMEVRNILQQLLGHNKKNQGYQ